MKHSKYKNLLFLHNILINLMTEDILNKNQGKAVNIYQRFFKKQSILAQQLRLYRLLYNPPKNTINGNKDKAIFLLQKVIKSYNNLNTQKANKQKYLLVKCIKQNYNLQEVFKRKLEDYLLYASIHNVLNENQNQKKLVQSVQNRYLVLQHIIKKTSQKQDMKQNIRDTKKITFQQAIKNFNSKYKMYLNQNQKRLLRKFIVSKNDDNFNQYICKHINKSKHLLQKKLKDVKNEIHNIKIKQIVTQLQKLQQNKIFKKQNIMAILYSYQLIKQLQSKEL